MITTGFQHGAIGKPTQAKRTPSPETDGLRFGKGRNNNELPNIPKYMQPVNSRNTDPEHGNPIGYRRGPFDVTGTKAQRTHAEARELRKGAEREMHRLGYKNIYQLIGAGSALLLTHSIMTSTGMLPSGKPAAPPSLGSTSALVQNSPSLANGSSRVLNSGANGSRSFNTAVNGMRANNSTLRTRVPGSVLAKNQQAARNARNSSNLSDDAMRGAKIVANHGDEALNTAKGVAGAGGTAVAGSQLLKKKKKEE